jgi:hypothetical protein
MRKLAEHILLFAFVAKRARSFTIAIATSIHEPSLTAQPKT